MPEYTFRVRWYQRQFHEALVNRTHDRLLAIWHRRAGKDEVVLNAMRTLALKDPGTYWHCFPEQKQARKAIWNGVNGRTGKRRILEAFPPEIIKRMQDDDMFIELTNGATFQLIGSDRYDSTVGSGPKGIAYSEWALSNPSAWAYHSPMIRESGGFAAFITTPRGNNHAKTMLDRAQRNKDSWFSQVLSINDTQALGVEQLKEALEEYQDLHGEEMGLALYEQEYECSFAGAMIGSYWGGAVNTAERTGRIKVVPVDPSHPVHTAWDLGKAVNNPIWCFQVIAGQVRIVDFYLPKEDDVEQWCIWLKEHGYTGTDYIPDDLLDPIWGAKHTRFDTLKALGRKPSLVKRIAVADGIHAGREVIKVAMFHKSDDPNDERSQRMEHGLEGLKNYRREWDDDRKSFVDNPYKDWAEHIGSSFRYLGLAWREAYKAPAPKHAPQKLELTATPTGAIMTNTSLNDAIQEMILRKRKQRNG